ncbi:hypothetical protein ISN44_As08g022170 [Arabidopsis suecica]|uniref:Uncharacterized protein n=1 Tax=Arabidopsis suecica TaxID=45249 RepID=A0A8T2B7B2_ARASU|nr:hypothetical protein ISN44_As08g022170 [Arabidopsis suecica]
MQVVCSSPGLVLIFPDSNVPGGVLSASFSKVTFVKRALIIVCYMYKSSIIEEKILCLSRLLTLSNNVDSQNDFTFITLCVFSLPCCSFFKKSKDHVHLSILDDSDNIII